jgi:GNAT superfamily N-acetyltransferase
VTDTRIALQRISAPETLDDAQARAFRALVTIGNAAARHDTGHDLLDQSLEEVWGFWRDGTDWEHVGFAAIVDGEVHGVAAMTVSTQEGTVTAEFDVAVSPARRGEGTEELLWDACEAEARARGLRTLHTWTLHRAGAAGERLSPSTRWGSIPADGLTRLLQRRGYTLEQVERTSAFDLGGSFDAVERLRAEALARMGEEYRRVQWAQRTPDAHLAAFAHAISRMSTDAPQGGLDIEEQIWDGDRVRRREARLREQGLTSSVAAVEHVPSGAIVAYNELVIGGDRTGATQQYGTLVLREHRGHRLGTVVKCENLLRWRTLVPTSPRVVTFNAEENRPMLSINEALGFVPVSYAGAWKLSLAT